MAPAVKLNWGLNWDDISDGPPLGPASEAGDTSGFQTQLGLNRNTQQEPTADFNPTGGTPAHAGAIDWTTSKYVQAKYTVSPEVASKFDLDQLSAQGFFDNLPPELRSAVASVPTLSDLQATAHIWSTYRISTQPFHIAFIRAVMKG
jgi:hypothetical protein